MHGNGTRKDGAGNGASPKRWEQLTNEGTSSEDASCWGMQQACGILAPACRTARSMHAGGTLPRRFADRCHRLPGIHAPSCAATTTTTATPTHPHRSTHRCGAAARGVRG